MKTFLTIVWHFPFLGFLQAIGHFLLGISLICTLIYIPVGLGHLQIGIFLFSPFDSELVSRSDFKYIDPNYNPSGGMAAFNMLNRILYFIPSIFITLGYLLATLLYFICIITIPCGLVYSKIITSIFNPINKVCVSKEKAEQIKAAKYANSTDKSNNIQIGDVLNEANKSLAPAIKRYFPVIIIAIAIIGNIIFSTIYPFFADIRMNGYENIMSGILISGLISQILVMISIVLLALKTPSASRNKSLILLLAIPSFISIAASIYSLLCMTETFFVIPDFSYIFLLVQLVISLIVYFNVKNNFIKLGVLLLLAPIAGMILNYILHINGVVFGLGSILPLLVSIAVVFALIYGYVLIAVGLYKDDEARKIVEINN